MNRYSEVESGAYMTRVENGFVVEVIRVEEKSPDPSEVAEAGEPPAMAEIRAQQMPKTKTPVPKVFVYREDELEEALAKLKEYFSE
jgi:hypothetical protein